MVDFLQIGYDNVEGDIPVLTVARKTKRCKNFKETESYMEILRTFTGEPAVDIYKLLTTSKK